MGKEYKAVKHHPEYFFHVLAIFYDYANLIIAEVELKNRLDAIESHYNMHTVPNDREEMWFVFSNSDTSCTTITELVEGLLDESQRDKYLELIESAINEMKLKIYFS